VIARSDPPAIEGSPAVEQIVRIQVNDVSTWHERQLVQQQNAATAAHRIGLLRPE
jgi:hypothetical protein